MSSCCLHVEQPEAQGISHRLSIVLTCCLSPCATGRNPGSLKVSTIHIAMDASAVAAKPAVDAKLLLCQPPSASELQRKAVLKMKRFRSMYATLAMMVA